VRGRPFEKGRSGNPLGRRVGCRNKSTIAAAALLAGEAEALTRKAVELAPVGDPTALRLCIERVLPQCRERTVNFALPPIESAADIAAAMKAMTSALAGGVITPGEAATIAAVVDTFVRAIPPTTRTPRPTFHGCPVHSSAQQPARIRHLAAPHPPAARVPPSPRSRGEGWGEGLPLQTQLP
jgi:hypothetical protein